MQKKFFIISWVFIVLGTALRTHHLLINRGFWLDEAYVAINAQAVSFFKLAQGIPFDAHLPSPPPGFNLIVKGFVTLFGSGEWAYRVFPYAASCLSIALFFYFARKFFKETTAALSTAFFAINPLMIYYAAELKPYSTDVLWSAVLFYAAFRFYNTFLDGRERLFLIFLGPAVFYFSHPSVFVMASIGLVWIIRPALTKDMKKLKAYGFVLACWALSIFTEYGLFYRPMHHNDLIMSKGVELAFVPTPVFSLSAASWLTNRLVLVFSEMTGVPGWISLPAFLIGAAGILKEKKDKGLILVLPLFATLAAVALHKYPLFSRMTLFYIPAATILFVKGIEIFVTRCFSRGKGIWITATAAAFLFFPAHKTWTQMQEGYRGENIREAVQYLKKHLREGDRIYVTEKGVTAFKYYAGRHDLVNGRLMIQRLGDHVYRKGDRKGMESIDEELIYDGRVYVGSAFGEARRILADDSRAFPAHPRSWFVFSHYKESRDFVLDWIDKNGRLLQSFEGGFSEVYLADLTDEN